TIGHVELSDDRPIVDDLEHEAVLILEGVTLYQLARVLAEGLTRDPRRRRRGLGGRSRSGRLIRRGRRALFAHWRSRLGTRSMATSEHKRQDSQASAESATI